MRPPVEFEAAARAKYALHDRYRLTPREAYVLRSAPIPAYADLTAEGQAALEAGQPTSLR
jgi:hypothetical protein